MTITLYHYVHCPFCIRVRMTAGLLSIPLRSRVLDYDDELLPVKLVGKKLLPIMDFEGEIMPESLDIMAKLDQQNKLELSEYRKSPKSKLFDEFLQGISNDIHSLTMPHWIYTPEFNEKSRNYFQEKKEVKRGPFKNLVMNRKKYEEPLITNLQKLPLNPFYMSNLLTVQDILLASHLWGLYIVPEFQFPENVHEYLQTIKARCNFDYHEDFRK